MSSDEQETWLSEGERWAGQPPVYRSGSFEALTPDELNEGMLSFLSNAAMNTRAGHVFSDADLPVGYSGIPTNYPDQIA